MDKTVYKKFTKLIYETSGIALNDKKEALVSSRIAKRMRALSIVEQHDYLRYVMQDNKGVEIVHLLDAISTNVTSFFREAHHFDILTDLMTKWLSKGTRRFRFWSAACSSGEEPYTMAMTLREVCNGHKADMRILATDISTKILQQSINGVYDSKKMNDVSPLLRERYFEKQGRGELAQFSARNNLKSMIMFKRLNLSVVPFPMSGPMDVIFCRNVMIYFDNDIRRQLLAEFYRLLKPGGYLMVGHAESLTGLLSGFKTVRPSVYVKG